MAELSNLFKRLLFLYSWQQEEIDDLAQSIEEQNISAWRDGMRAQAAKVGCRNATPRDPSGKYLREIRDLARMDAESIANTWRDDVRRQLERLYAENPRGNRSFYYSRMERWASQRGAWKNLQIGLMNEQNGYYIAQRAFLENNNLNVRLYYSGPTAVSDICIERKAMGLVDEATAMRETTPAHIGCPHTWEIAMAGNAVICGELWLG